MGIKRPEKSEDRLAWMETEFVPDGDDRHLNTNYPSSEILRAQMLAHTLGDPAGLDLPGQAWKANMIAAIMWSYSGPPEKEGIARRQTKEMWIGKQIVDQVRREFGLSIIPNEEEEKFSRVRR